MLEIGVDVGGTFTDVVVRDSDSDATSWLKVATDEASPTSGVLAAIDAAGVEYERIKAITLGTTLSVNAILTRSGAPTGLITTEGFRDVLEIRRTHRESMFDLDEVVPLPLVPRDLRLEVPERIGADGEVVTPLDEDAVARAWRYLKGRGIKTVAIAFLFSFENPAHERRARDIIVNASSDAVVVISSDVLPTFREYERTSTTVIAAYIGKIVTDYVSELGAELTRRGAADTLAIMTNSGGAASARTIPQSPLLTLMSGPVAGVEAARWIAEQAGWRNVLTMDMGGTSCDVSGIVEGIADERLDMEIGGHTISYPTYDIQSIGAGGGSIAWVDAGGSLRVGPQSAGSTPGPACYGRGGRLPTVTDANLVLGRYDSHVPLGGALALDLDDATNAIRECVADPLAISVEQAATGIIRIVNVMMMNAIRTISVERGRDVRDYTLVAYGGAGPTHAAEIAQALAIPQVLVPPFAGCTSAFGGVIANQRQDLVQTINRAITDVSLNRLLAIVDTFAADGRAALQLDGLPAEAIETETWLDLKYEGQAHSLSVLLEPSEVSHASLSRAVKRFHTEHQQLYGHSFGDIPVELVNVRVKVVGRQGDKRAWWDWEHVGETITAPGERQVWFDGICDFALSGVHTRHALRTDEIVAGPAVIHQVDTTILVPPGFAAKALEGGSLVLSSRPALPTAPLATGSQSHETPEVGR